jgi:hypothetical protein
VPTYERSDADPRLLAALAGGLALFLAAVPLCLLLIYPGAVHRPPAPAPAADIPGPRLQIEPALDLARLRAAEQAQLAGYGWLDRERGVVRIPIERAMGLIAARGLPGWR